MVGMSLRCAVCAIKISRGLGCSTVVVHLPCMFSTLGLIPSTKNNIKKLIQIGRLIVVKSTISILFETSHVKVTINFYNILSEIQV